MKCKHIKQNGSTCKANAMRGGSYCYIHNPAIETKEKREAQSRGGKANIICMPAEVIPELNIETATDIKTLIVDTINRVRAGGMDIRIANCIGFLSGQLIKVFELTEIEERIVNIEKQILKQVN